jgi:two-component system, chemotaxis family, chemotaxis protein CheY
MLNNAPTEFASLQLGLLGNDDFSASLVKSAARTCSIRDIDVYSNPNAAMVALIARTKPDIMLVHHRQKEVGLAFCRAVRDRETSPAPFLPIIMISAQVTRQDVVAARDAGVDEFLASPFSPKMFSARIGSVVFNRRGFIAVDGYFGPDRRRGAIAEMLGVERRSTPTKLIDPVSGKIYIG